MKRILFSLPMLGVALFFIASGLYDALSDYYPEAMRPAGFLLALWGSLLVLLLGFTWVRPSRPLFRVLAGVAFLPICFITLGNIWSSFQFGWELGANDVMSALSIGIALVIAYSCVLHMAHTPTAG